MDSKNIIESALLLSPAEKLLLIETLSKSLNETNEEVEKFWKDEVEKRYAALSDNKVKTISYDDLKK